jgi:MFS family permease
MDDSTPATMGLERRYIAAATIGNALEFYDFLTYALFAIQIGRTLFPTSSAYASLMLSLATFGVGFLTRPLGAVVLGAYADRAGRKPAMLLCLTLIGVSITVMALIPPYARIGLAAPILAVLARLVQGFSLGGEIGSNTAYLAEAARPERRGWVVSWQGASQLMALIAGNLVGTVITSWLSPAQVQSYGWRIALLLGAATVPFGLWLRSALPETLHAPHPEGPAAAADAAAGVAAAAPAPATAATAAAAAVAAAAASRAPREPGAPAATSTRTALVRRHLRVMLLGLVVLAAATIGSYIFTYIATYAQNTLHLPARAGFEAELAAFLVGLPVTMLGGWASDRIGRRPVNVWGNLVVLLAIYPVFAWIVAAGSPGVLIAGTALLYAATSITTGSFYTGLVEALPTSIRSSGFGTVYSLSIALFGGTTQLVVTWLIHITGSSIAPAWYLIGATGIGQIALMLFPETAPVRQRERAAQKDGTRPGGSSLADR